MPTSTSSGLPVKDSYKEYDFLKGEGPSAQQHYYDPLEKKAFRPGWQAKKHVGGAQESERQRQESQKVERAQMHANVRREQIEQRQLRNAYNPITGQEFNNATKSSSSSSSLLKRTKCTGLPHTSVKIAQGFRQILTFSNSLGSVF
ncbi:hypothetical protein DUNSADRAFT_15947 [Dunaliella salina]|uniref:Uncharacterized protein n=1 Tax=Dunaliella salina TaxID=3046 RepID=A0ABQ7G4J2_DUNSA|nr:hypothetical protein DUNSADRAFT_15947 [Dunaliella salina]|eukprot:KAF5829530.1 hypothetical protein DUNSADRAFT_15947 [Dunaliella salina]